MKHQKGFTLIELIIVATIIFVLGSLVKGCFFSGPTPVSAPAQKAAAKNVELIAPTPVPATPAK